MKVHTISSCPIEPFEIKFKEGVPETLQRKLGSLISDFICDHKLPPLTREFFLKVGDPPDYAIGSCGPHLARFYYPVDENNIPLYHFSDAGIAAFKLRVQELPENCGFKIVVRHPEDIAKGLPVFEVETIRSEGTAAITGKRFDAHMKSLTLFMADYRFVILKGEV